jgi:hypothetical protein
MKVSVNVEDWENNYIEFHESDTWNMDSILGYIILNSLIEFRKHATEGTPQGIESNDEWLVILDSMISSFDLIQDDIMNYHDHEETINLGLNNFAKYLPSLWT